MQADYTVKLACLLAAGWAQIPWSLIRANVKTFPTAPFVPLKTILLAWVSMGQRLLACFFLDACFASEVNAAERVFTCCFKRGDPKTSDLERRPSAGDDSRYACRMYHHPNSYANGDFWLRLMLGDRFLIPSQ